MTGVCKKEPVALFYRSQYNFLELAFGNCRQQQLQSVMDEAMSVCQQSSLGGVHCDNTRQLHAERDIILPRLQQFELAQNQMALANTASLEDVLHSYQV